MSQTQTDRELRQDVGEVLVRYATSIDRKDWARFRTCFTEDARGDYGEVGVWDGLDALAGFMVKMHPESIRTLHRISNVEVEGEGDRAVARSYVDVVFVQADSGRGVRSAGTYDDELVRTGDGWRIRRRRFRQVHRESLGER